MVLSGICDKLNIYFYWKVFLQAKHSKSIKGLRFLISKHNIHISRNLEGDIRTTVTDMDPPGYSFKVFDGIIPAEKVIDDVREGFVKSCDAVVEHIEQGLEPFKTSINSKLKEQYADVRDVINEKVTNAIETIVAALNKSKDDFIEKFDECSRESIFHLNCADEGIYHIMETNISSEEAGAEFDQTIQDWIDKVLVEIYAELKKCIRIPTVAVLTTTNNLKSQFSQIETCSIRLFKSIEKDIEEKLPDEKATLLENIELHVNKFVTKSKGDIDTELQKAVLVLQNALNELETACLAASEKAQTAIDSRQS